MAVCANCALSHQLPGFSCIHWRCSLVQGPETQSADQFKAFFTGHTIQPPTWYTTLRWNMQLELCPVLVLTYSSCALRSHAGR